MTSTETIFEKGLFLYMGLEFDPNALHGHGETHEKEVSASGVIAELSNLAARLDNAPSEVVDEIKRMLEVATNDYGAAIRTTLLEGHLYLDIHGLPDFAKPEMTEIERSQNQKRQSGVSLTLSPKFIGVRAHTNHLEADTDGRDFDEVINEHLDRLTKTEVAQIAEGIFEIALRLTSLHQGQ